MMSSAAPISVFSSQRDKQQCNLFSKKNGVLLVSFSEMVGSLGFMMLYIYAMAVKPKWANFLVPIPNDLCNSTNLVHGVMYVIVLLCVMELLLSLFLFDGVRQEKLDTAQVWLASMLTYLVLVTIIIFGLNLGNVHCPSLNSFAFINLFVRFLQILTVYTWIEQQKMTRRITLAGLGFARTTRYGTTRSSPPAYFATAAVNPGFEQDETPPPSYSATLPGYNVNLYHPPPPSEESYVQNV